MTSCALTTPMTRNPNAVCLDVIAKLGHRSRPKWDRRPMRGMGAASYARSRPVVHLRQSHAGEVGGEMKPVRIASPMAVVPAALAVSALATAGCAPDRVGSGGIESEVQLRVVAGGWKIADF
jgi:hypothetical protein